MKFCTKCGGQCVDEAVICVSCGSAIAPAAPTAPAAPVIPSASPLKSGDNKLAIFDLASNISILLYVTSFVLSVVYAYIWESSSSSWFSSYSYTYFELDEIFVAISAVIALFVFAFAILRLVSGLSQKGNLKVMLSGVFRLITAIIIAVVSVLAVIEYPL